MRPPELRSSSRSDTTPEWWRAVRRTTPGCSCWDQAARLRIDWLSRPRARGRQRAAVSTGASMTTSTSYYHATARCSSSMAIRSRSPGRAEGVVEHLDAADPIDSVFPLGVLGDGSAQQVPAAVTYDDRPRVDLGDPLRPGLRAVVESNPSAVGAGLHQRGRGPGSGRAVPRSGAAAVVRLTTSAGAATDSGNARTILTSALPTGLVGPVAS